MYDLHLYTRGKQYTHMKANINSSDYTHDVEGMFPTFLTLLNKAMHGQISILFASRNNSFFVEIKDECIYT